MLNAEQVDRYRHDGYLFPFPALSSDEITECRAGLDRFEGWLGEPVTQADRKWRSAGYIFLPWVDVLVRHPRILDAVESLIGPNILVYTSTFFIKEPNSPVFAAWHQDATYFGLTPHVGGRVGAQIIGALLGGGGEGAAAAGAGGLDIGSIVGQIVSGGVGGGILMAIVGLIKQVMGGQKVT